MPPRHGKSEEVSRLFTAYYLYRHPERWVGVTSYAADLAYTLSRAARDNYRAIGGALRGDAEAVKHWETPEGGGLWAAGVGGPITGKGFHLGVIDDPLKNAEEAESETIRAKQKEWYQSTFYTREEPGGAIVVIQTRWHEDDLSGWLLEEERAEDEESEGWHVVSFEAVKESHPLEIPLSCTLEPDPRPTGAALCPERYPLERLRKIAARVGDYFFGALFQQRATPREGAFFKVSQLGYLDAEPAGLRSVRAWDLGATAGAGDYTAGVRLGTDGAGRFIVSDVRRGQWGPEEADAEVLSTAALDTRTVSIRGAQDPGAAGKRDAKAWVRMLAGYVVSTEHVTGPKETRARALASQVNAGNVSLVKGPWNRAFVEELRSFPLGRNNDQVDAVSDAFEELTRHTELQTDDELHASFFSR